MEASDSSAAPVQPVSQARILLDTPSREPALGFGPIAQAFADVIQASDPRFAIGVFGGWGAGKTTLMEAIEARLPAEVLSVRFNAWRYEREPHLIVPLLDTVRDALADWARDHPEHSGAARQTASRIGGVVRSLLAGLSVEAGVPGAVKLSYRVKDALDASDEDEDGARPVQSLYFAAFKELTQAFEELAKKTVKHIVVFVDDLDRCFPASALEMLEAMKLFFDLPGFVFVVGLDENVVKRAVDAKFAATGFAERTPETVVDGPSPEEYIKKIFQLPFALPPMTTQQLDELLTSIESEAGVEGDQLADLKGRVRNYLRFVAVDGRVNPREVKRYINAYTLQVLIRPSLDRDTMLALQSLAFRGDWQDAYELVLAYPEVFVDALRRYRAGESGALEDLWPQLRAMPAALSAYLRSPEAEPLLHGHSLQEYLYALQATRTTRTWLLEAFRSIGQLRQLAGKAEEDVHSLGDAAANALGEQMVQALSGLGGGSSRSPEGDRSRLEPHVARLRDLAKALATAPAPGGEPPAVADWVVRFREAVDRAQAEVSALQADSAVGAAA